MNLHDYIKNGPSGRNIRKWIWGICKWGKTVQVKTASSFAWNCLFIWEDHADNKDWEYAFGSNSLRKALLAVSEWLEDQNEDNIIKIQNLKEIVEKDINNALFAHYEASGSAELFESRERACLAAISALETCKAALWTEEKAKIGFENDLEEVKSIVKSGPALECTEAIWSASKAQKLNIEEIKELLEESILNKSLKQIGLALRGF